MKDTNQNTKVACLTEDPEYIKLQKEQAIQAIKIDSQNIHRGEVNILDMRIENARRNVQLLASLCYQYYDRGLSGNQGVNKSNVDVHKGLEEFNKESLAALLLNVKILNETGNIK